MKNYMKFICIKNFQFPLKTYLKEFHRNKIKFVHNF